MSPVDLFQLALTRLNTGAALTSREIAILTGDSQRTVLRRMADAEATQHHSGRRPNQYTAEAVRAVYGARLPGGAHAATV
jgi:hypothetical protein